MRYAAMLAALALLLGPAWGQAQGRPPGAPPPVPSPAAEPPGPPPWCLPDTTWEAQRLRTHLETILTSRARARRGLRRSVHWRAGSAVEWITDEGLCREASRALDRSYFAAPRGQAVYVVRVGQRVAVYPPGVVEGEWAVLVHFDAHWRRGAAVWLW